MDEDNNKILKCTKCKDKYNLSPNGHCIHYQSYYEFIPHCAITLHEVVSNINNSIISEADVNYESDYLPISYDNDYDDNYDNYDNHYDHYDDNNDTDLFERGESNIDNINFPIQSSCSKCKTGYYKKDGKCEGLTVDECSFLSIINSLNLDN